MSIFKQKSVAGRQEAITTKFKTIIVSCLTDFDLFDIKNLLPLIFDSAVTTLGETKLGLIFDNWDKLKSFFPGQTKTVFFLSAKSFKFFCWRDELF